MRTTPRGILLMFVALVGCDSTNPNREAAPLDTGLGFSLTVSPKLKQSSGIPGLVAFTRDGKTPSLPLGDPLFLVAISKSRPPASNHRDFALMRIRNTSKTSFRSIKSNEPIVVAGLDGFESVAEARKLDWEMDIVLYQLLLFEQDHYIIFQGFARPGDVPEFLPEFKSMARSLVKSSPQE
ncbi:MAG: hypothetical protein IT428_08045 [Planctomycetaceae bacterium]|nr:hypothetical protein [Planctomycetaceae bacterium]